jgi:hypothetical protein
MLMLIKLHILTLLMRLAKYLLSNRAGVSSHALSRPLEVSPAKPYPLLAMDTWPTVCAPIRTTDR